MSRGMKAVCWMLAVTLIGTMGAQAKKKAPAKVELSEKGQKLEAAYAEQLAELKTEIQKALPKIGEAKKTAYLNSIEAEKAAIATKAGVQKGFGEIKKGQGLVGHAKGKWIGGAERGIADTKAKLKEAKTDEEREELKKKLAGWEKNRQDGLDALKERQAFLDKALKEEPRLKKEMEAAEKALAEAKAGVAKALEDLGLDKLLKSDKLDAKLAKCELMTEATPNGLAAYAEKGKDQEKRVERLLSDDDLMVQMMIADGAKSGKYGEALEIYEAIQKVSKKANEGDLQKFALAVALEHAVPLGQRNPTGAADAPETIDPVARYLHYEKAFLAGELDEGFKGLSVWDYRMVVDGNEPDETLAWGREMLRTYRPDHITTDDYRWRYVAAVRSDIRYGSQYNKFDKPELQFFQNILMNGGVCGRRAFFGRFMLRSFGVPTTARPQPGHAALTHWTPDGWVVCLGGGWGAGTTKGRYTRDRDFLANTQAREVEEKYPQVKRAQWLGRIEGEKPVYGLLSGAPEFWHSVALYTQRGIIEDAEAVALAAVGEDIGEANETKEKVEIVETKMSDEDKKVVVAKDGTITIPAASCSKPTESTGKIIFMESNLGGKQLHYSRTGEAQDFEYTFEAPKAGKYLITARIASPTGDQHLMIKPNGAEEAVDMEIPLTVGLWGETEPVEITLQKGKNVLHCSRAGENIRGVTIRDFTLTPKG